MSTNIRFKRSDIPGKVPSLDSIDLGELALNTADGKLFTKQEIKAPPGAAAIQKIVEIGAMEVPNVLYVAKNGDDSNSGKTLGQAFLTLKKALSIATPGTTIFLKSGEYIEDNPLRVPARVSVVGDNLRNTTVRPKNPTKDIFWVYNGAYIFCMNFKGHIAPSAAVCFPPDGSAGEIVTSPYTQAVTSITTTGTGMRVDGALTTGLRSMVCDAFTQYNQGGIGIHMLNRGNTQLVSIFTICCDISFMCENGGFCSVNLSNSSFGNYGLVSRGASDPLYRGVVKKSAGRQITFKNLAKRPNIGDGVLFANYNQTTCDRDNGLVVDSLAFDLLYEGTSQSTFAGLRYWAKDDITTGIQQQVQTAAAIKRAQTVAMNVVKNIAVDSPGNSASQVTNLTVGSDTAKRIVGEEFEIISRIVADGPKSPALIVGPDLTAAEPEYRTLREQVLDRKAQIADQTIKFLTDNYPSLPYVSSKCKRDVTLVIEAVADDMIFGTNYKSIKAAISYLTANVDNFTIVEEQRIATIEAFKFARDKVVAIVQEDATLLARVQSNFEIITNTLRTDAQGGGADYVAGLTINYPAQQDTDPEVLNLVDNLQANKAYVTAEVIDYINKNWPQVVSYGYSETTCSRDVKYSIDAICYDILYGGNSQTLDAAKRYFNYASGLPELKSSEEVPATIDAFGRAQLLSQRVVILDPIESGQAPVDQVINGLTATTQTQVNRLGNLFSIFLKQLETDIVGTSDFIQPNGKRLNDVGLERAFDILQANKQFIRNDVVNYLSRAYPGFDYDRVKCSRDVAYIVDSVCFDLVHGGNRQAVTAGIYYFDFNEESNVLKSVLPNQIKQTVNAYKYMKELLRDVLTCSPTPNPWQEAVPQRTDLDPATGSEVIAIGNLIDIINEILQEGPNNAEDSIQRIKQPISLVASNDPNKIRAFDLLMANREFIRAEMLAYINQNWYTISDGDTQFARVNTATDLTLGTTTTGYPTVTYQPSVYKAIRDAVLAAKEDIKTETIKFMANSFFDNFSFNKPKCYRDVGLILDAILSDMIFGSNYKTITAAISYLRAYASEVVGAQKVQTVASLKAAKNITLARIVAPSAKEEISTRFDIVIDILDGARVNDLGQTVTNALVNGVSYSPTAGYGTALTFPMPVRNSELDIDRKTAVDILRDNVDFIKDEIVAYIDANFTLNEFDREKCARDVGFIIDALGYDMMFLSNFRAISAGRSYLRANTAKVTGEQKLATIGSFKHLKKLVTEIVKSNNLAVNSVQRGMDIIIDIVDKGVGAVPKYIIPFPATGREVEYKRSRDLVQKNRDFIIDDVITYINTPGLVLIPGSVEFELETIQGTGPTAVKLFYEDARFTVSYEDLTGAVELDVGDLIRVSGKTFGTSTINGYSSPSTYKVASRTNSTIDGITHTTQFKLVNLDGSELVTFGGTSGKTTTMRFEKVSAAAYADPAGFNIDNCRRDLELILDALFYDTTYGGTLESHVAGKAYVAGVLSQLNPLGNQSDEVTATLRAYTYLRSLVETVAQDIAWVPTVGNTTTQVRSPSGSDGSATAAKEMATCVNLILKLIDDANTEDLDTQLATIPSDPSTAWCDPALVKAHKQLQAAREDTKDAVATFVDENYVLFGYDRDKCKRDVGYVIEAVRWDMMFNSNFRSIVAGRSYYRAMASVVVKDQKTATLASFQHLKDKLLEIVKPVNPDNPTTAESLSVLRVTRSMDIILNILENGLAVEPTVLLTEPTGGTGNAYSTADRAQLRDDIQDNRVTIENSLITWIDGQITTGQPFAGVTYNKTACRRDVEYILDALIYDLTYGGTMETTVAARAYYANADDGIPLALGSDEKALTLAAYNQLKSIIDANSTASSVAPTNALITVIYNYINTGTEVAADEPDYDWIDNGIKVFGDKLAVTATINRLKTAVTDFVDFNFAYNKDKCARDVGFLIDAMCYDLLYGGNVDTTQAAVSYYNGAVTPKSIIPKQIIQTVAAYERLKEVLGQVVQLKDVVPSGNQFQAKARATASMDLIIKLVKDGPAFTPKKPFLMPAPTSGTDSAADSDWLNATKMIAANRAFLTAEVTAFIKTTYPNLVYNQVKCERDVDLIIDAVLYDLTYGGKVATTLTAEAYYEGTSATLSGVSITGTAGEFSCTSTKLKVGDTVKITGTLGGTGTITGYATGNVYKISVTNGSTTFTLVNLDDSAIVTTAGTPTGLTYTHGRLPSSLDGELTESLAAYTYLGTLLELVAAGETVATGARDTYQNRVVQRVGQGDDTGDAATRAKELVQDVLNPIIDGDADTDAAAIAGPSTAWVDEKLVALSDAINNSTFRDDVKAEVNTLLTTKFDINYAGTQKTQCEQDIDAVIDAVRFDVMFGSNYRSQLAGNAYYRGFSGLDNVLGEQKDGSVATFELVKDAILEKVALYTTEQDKSGQAGTQAAGTQAAALIQVILDDIAGAPANLSPAPTDWVDSDLVDLSDILEDSKTGANSVEDIPLAVTNYISNRFPAPDFTYDVTSCQDDIKDITEAVRYDMMFNSNFRTITAARAYFRAQAALAVGVQKTATLESFKFLKEKLSALVSTNATAVERVQDRMDLLIRIVDKGEKAVPAFSLPSPTGYNSSRTGTISFGYARNLIESNREFLKAEVLKFIRTDSAIPLALDFNETKCLEDLDLILDAVYYDMTYGGNMESRVAGQAYYLGTTPTDSITGDEVLATTLAYGRLKDMIELVAQGIDVSDLQIIYPQVQGEPGSVAGAQTAKSLAFTVRNLINQIGDFAVPAPTFVEPNLSWVTSDLKLPNDLLVLMKTTDAAATNYTGRYSVQSQLTEWIKIQQDQARVNAAPASLTTYTSGPLKEYFDDNGIDVVGNWKDWFAVIPASAMVNGRTYVIADTTNGIGGAATDFTGLGAGVGASVGTEFTYNGSAVTGTGRVVRYLNANQMEAGKRYKIRTVGDTSWNTHAVSTISVAQNSTFIAKEAGTTIANMGTVYEMFTYDITKCERDIALIIDAVRFDMMFGTSFRTATAARSYWRQQANSALATGSTALSNYPQKEQSVLLFTFMKEVLQNLPSRYPSKSLADAGKGELPSIADPDYALANTRIGLLMDYIVNVVDAANLAAVNAALPAKPYVLPLPTGGTNNSKDAGFRAARDLIEANRSFVKAEVLAWIDQQQREAREGFQNNPDGDFDTDFAFDRTECAEDLDLILDAIYYDLTYGGNMESYTAGLAYYAGTGIDSLPADEREATIRAYNFLGQTLYNVARSVLSTSYQTALEQIKGTAGSVETAERINQLVDIVLNVVKGGVKQIPPREDPDFLSGDETLAYVRIAVQEQKQELQARIADYIDSFILQYNTEKCARDVGLILDAAMYDMVLNSNFQSITAGSVYLQKAAQVVTNTQIGPQLQAIKFIRDRVIEISQKPPLVKNEAAIGRITNLFDTMFDIIDKGVEVAPEVVNVPPLGAAFNPNAVNAANSILANKEFLKEEVVAYITANYKTYDQSRCSRDVGLIIDAALYDLLLSTNYNSVKAGLAYRRATSSLVVTDQLKETLGGIDFAKQKVVELLDDADAIASVTRSFELISSIIGGGSVPTSIVPIPGGSVYALSRPSGTNYRDPAFRAAASALLDDKATLQTAVTDWIDSQVSANTADASSIWSGYTYDDAKCEEDVGFIIDAIAYDLIYGGNMETVNAGYAYYAGTALAPLPDDQVPGTIAAYTYLADQVRATVAAATGASEQASLEAQDLVLLIRNLVDTRANAVAQVQIPSQIWVDPLLQEISQTIVTDKPRLQDVIIDYVNNIGTYTSGAITKPADYDVDKCRRDVGLVLDAVRYDLMFGTNFRTIVAGRSYRRAIAALITETQANDGQADANISAFKELRERVLGKKLVGVQIGSVTGEFTCTAPVTDRTNPLVVGQPVRVAGVYGTGAGTLAGFSNIATQPKTYYIIDTNGTTTFQLSDQVDGDPIVTTLGTSGAASTTGLTFEIRPSLDSLDEVITQGLLDVLTLDAEDADTPLVVGQEYKIISDGKTVTPAGEFITGGQYRVETIGTSDFNGAAGTTGITYQVGDIFTAVNAGIGTGTATYYTDYTEFGARNNNEGTVFVATGSPSSSTGGSGQVKSISFREQAERLFDLFLAILENEDNDTATVNGGNVTTDVFTTSAAHGFSVNDAVEFSTNASDYGLSQNTTYYILTAPTATTFTLSTELGGSTYTIPGASNVTSSMSMSKSTKIEQLGFNHSADFNIPAKQGGDNTDGYFYLITPPTLSSTDFDVAADYTAAVAAQTARITARNNINAARQSLEDDLIDWIDAQIAANTAAGAGNFQGFSYDATQCRKDIKFILDAIAYDLTFGGNMETVVAGKAYYDGTSLLSTTDGDEKLQTIDAYNYFKTIIGPVAAASSGDDETVLGLIDNIISYIDPKIEDPVVIEADTSWVDSELYTFSDLLKANAQAVAKSTTDYVNANFPSVVYSVAKCQRDVRLVIDAVRWDMMFSSEFRTVVAARSYYRSMASTVVGAQREATEAAFRVVKVALDDLVKSDAVAQARVSELMDIVINLLDAGETNQAAALATLPAVSLDIMPYGGTPNASEIGYLNARDRIEENRDFILAEMRAWLATQSATTSTLTDYSEDTCIRDVELVLDALRYDLTYGGNLESVTAGKAYYAGTVLGGNETAHKDLTKDAFAHLALVVKAVATNATTYQGSIVPAQVTSNDPGSALAADQAKVLVETVRSYVDTNSGDALVRPSTNWVDNNLALFASTMLDRKESLALQVTDFVSAEFPAPGFTYSVPDCQDDVKDIVEAVRYDMMFGTNFRSWTAGRAYYRSVASTVIAGQKEASLAAMRLLKSLLVEITGSNVTATNRVKSAMNVVIDTLEQGPTTRNANDARIRAAVEAIDAGKDTVLAAMGTYLDNNEATYDNDFNNYDKTTCLRDIEYLIDAIKYDLTYGGNMETVVAGRAYYGGAVLESDNADHIDATQAAFLQVATELKDLSGVEASVGVLIDALVANANDLIDDLTSVSEVYADASWSETALQEFSVAMRLQTTAIKAQVTDYVDTKFPTLALTYDKAKCARDVGLLIDAVRWDMLFNSNFRSVTAGRAYYRDSLGLTADALASLNQKQASVAAFTFLKGILQGIVASSAIAYERVTANMDIILEIIEAGLGNQTNPTITYPAVADTERTLASEILRANIPFIKDEIIKYIDATYSNIEYDEALCARDVEYITYAVAYDMVTGSNYHTVTAARGYLRGYASGVLDPKQKHITLLAFIYLKNLLTNYVGGNSSAVTAVKASLDVIIDTINAESVAGLTVTVPTANITTTAEQDAVNAWLTDATNITAAKAAGITASGNSGGGSSADCERDIGYVLEALAHDITYGGNWASIIAAKAYRNGTGTIQLTNAGEEQATVDAFEGVRDYINTEIATAEGLDARVTALIAIITGVVNSASYTVPAVEYPELLGSNNALEAARNVLISNVANAKAKVLRYVNDRAYFEYEILTCERDIGLILDAVHTDIATGSNYLSVQAGRAYLRSSASDAIAAAQKWAILPGLVHAKSVLSALVSTNASAVSAIRAKLGVVIDIINDESDANVTLSYPQDTTTASSDNNSKAAATAIVANKATVITSVINTVNSANQASGYNQATCERDLSYIIDAVVHDLLYGGNWGVTVAAKSYWEGGVNKLSATNTNTSLAQEIAATTTALNALISQLKGLGGVTGTADTTVENLVNRIKDIIDDADATAVNAYTITAPSTAGSDLATAVSTLTAAKETSQYRILDFINSRPFLVYNQAKCETDVGIILDALRYDIMLGSNFKSIKAGQAYLRSYAKAVTQEQKSATIASLYFIKKSVSEALDADANVASASVTSARELMDTIIDILDRGVLATPEIVIATSSSTATATTNADDLITVNSTAWMSANQPIKFTGTAFGNIVAGTTYYVKTIDSVNSQITISDTLSSGVAGAAFDVSTATGTMQVVNAAFDANTVITNNQDFIKAEVRAYLDRNYPELDYNKIKCERDVQYILDALRYDLAFAASSGQANSETREAGLAYWEGNALTLGAHPTNIDDPDLDGGEDEKVATVAAYTELASIVKKLLDNSSYTAQQSIVSKGSYASLATFLSTAAQTLITKIKDMVNAANLTAAQAVVAETLPANAGDTDANTALVTLKGTLPSLTTTEITAAFATQFFVYNKEKCARDVGFVVEGLAFDALFGGNKESREVALQYAYKGGLVIPMATKGPTVGAFERLVAIVDDIVAGDLVDTSSTVTATTDTGDLITVESTTWMTVNQAIKFSGTAFGNIVAGTTYYVKTIDSVNSQITISDTLSSGVAGTVFDVSDDSGTMQVTSADAVQVTANPSSLTGVSDLAQIVVDVLKDGASAAPDLVDPTFADVTGFKTDYLVVRSIVRDSIDRIAANTITFINETYAGFGYLQDTCKRDVGLTLDAVAYDLIYGGNSRTKFASEQYYSGGRFQIPADSKSATVACFVYLDALVRKVIANDPIVTFQNYVDQDKSNPAATNSEVINVANLFDAFTDILINGYISVVQLDATFRSVVNDNTYATFHQVSTITTTGHTLEWVGTGIDVDSALPYNGGVPKPENQLVSEKGGFINFTSTDEKGDFRIGPDLTIKRDSGSIVGRAFNKSLLGVITPYILALQG